MHLSSLLALAATCSAAVVPREESKAEPLRTLIYGPLPVDDSFSLLATPEILTPTKEELLKKVGPVTEAPPSDNLLSIKEARDIIGGKDDRVLKLDTTYPWNAMGRVTVRAPTGTWICSGSIVGPRVVLTARHCIISGATYTFSPAYDNGDRLPTATATTVIRLPGTNDDNGGCGWKDDWALLVLNRNLNNGYLGFKLFQDNMSNANLDWWNYGYPGDIGGASRPFAQNRFRVQRIAGCGSPEGRALDSNADAAGGQSGGPVWIPESDGRYQYAVLVGGNSASTIFSHGSALLNAIVAARRDFP